MTELKAHRFKMSLGSSENIRSQHFGIPGDLQFNLVIAVAEYRYLLETIRLRFLKLSFAE